MSARIILVGGFLGAGKTTLLFETARKLTERGKSVGLITNDQAAELVDTTFLEYTKGDIKEVSGSCFCCNYNGFTGAITQLMEEKQAEVIVAEPVGSCTDLSATIVQPLKKQFPEELAIAPLSVLVDPKRLQDILDGAETDLHTSASYIIEKQLEEADVIVINKTDLLTGQELENLKSKVALRWPLATLRTMSLKTGEGLEQWLDEVTHRQNAGTHLAEVDYDIYAEGEAVLGWLNTSIELKGQSVSWDTVGKKLLEAFSDRFDSMKAAVGHVKLIIENGEEFVLGNITGKKETMDIRGTAGISDSSFMRVNARVQMAPEKLEDIVLEELKSVFGDGVQFQVKALKCLSPGRPEPTYRFDNII